MNTPRQPGFYTQKEASGIAPSEYDNLSDDELLALINGANALKGSRARVGKQVQPQAKRVVDLDALIEANRG